MPNSKTFTTLLIAVSLGFAWMIWPLFGAIFWAVTLAIVFDPMSRRLQARMGGRRNLASVAMVLGIVLVIILPMLMILAAVVREATSLVEAVKSGQIDLHAMFQDLMNILPGWSKDMLLRFGISDLTTLQDGIPAAASDWLAANGTAFLTFGRSTAGAVVELCVMLYLTFFLFRDGDLVLARIKAAIPMERSLLDDLLQTFTVVVRATVRGDIVVALLQGTVAGLGFWVLGVHAVLLWMVLMSVLSLFPVFGAALVWVPVAIYFLAKGMIWHSLALTLYGVLVVGLIDNIVRPWLVGQATRMPDYLVLISTLGGITTFGMQGFITGPVMAALFLAVWTTCLARPRD